MEVRTALVVGGTGDIGSAVVHKLRAEGVHTVCAAMDVPEDTAEALRVDITDEASVTALFEKVAQALGPLGVLINCAGIGVFSPVEETPLSEWRRTLEVNLTGAFLCAREAFKRMKAHGGGRILHIGSVSDHLTLPMNAAYAASKHGLRGLTGVLNEEGKAHGVRATLVSLGAVYTSLWHARPEFSPADMLPLEEVAQCLWEIARKPLNVRVDEIRLLPSKGVL
ncbi:SDR family oxidoreductase [Stigmatella hybrida]|uniref:SDR family oxidoreductase n=1 Tax=Stigmatella hybrida TaxID=394097 RepID=UPI001CDACF37|nr:SDR family oxidoreductase [Stigmatella hybrida]